MNDLISRESIRKPIYAEEDNITGQGMTIEEIEAYNRGIDDMYERIKKAPTIEATKVIHGHWYKIKKDGCTILRCSRCDWSLQDLFENNLCEDIQRLNYCNCGAKMDGVGDIYLW